MNKKRILIIGGSPCSGKSTVAERISKEYGAYYFKADDFLEKFMNLAAEQGHDTCKSVSKMSPNEIWMREPLVQCIEEFAIYDEISDLVFEQLDEFDADFIITEGAALKFTLYEDGENKWSMELVGTGIFDLEDEDW